MGKFVEELDGVLVRTKGATEQLSNFNAILEEINEEVCRNITGEQAIEFLRTMGVCECTINQARLRTIQAPSSHNTDVFFDNIKVSTGDMLVNNAALKYGYETLESLNLYIRAFTQAMFENLNESDDENRGYKAICIRRDICRLKAVLFRMVNVPKYEDIDWTKIEVKEDYIDAVDTTFLDDYFRWSPFHDKEYWWTAANKSKSLVNEINARRSFLKRLVEFKIDV